MVDGPLGPWCYGITNPLSYPKIVGSTTALAGTPAFFPVPPATVDGDRIYVVCRGDQEPADLTGWTKRAEVLPGGGFEGFRLWSKSYASADGPFYLWDSGIASGILVSVHGGAEGTLSSLATGTFTIPTISTSLPPSILLAFTVYTVDPADTGSALALFPLTPIRSQFLNLVWVAVAGEIANTTTTFSGRSFDHSGDPPDDIAGTIGIVQDSV